MAAAVPVAVLSAGMDDFTARDSLSASAPPGLSEVRVCVWLRPPWVQIVVWSMRACRDTFWPSGRAFVPQRKSPSAMLHSKVTMLSSPHAARTMLMACISSDVSITTMGVEELMSTFRRSSPSVIFWNRSARITDRLSSFARPFGFAQGKLAEGGCPHIPSNDLKGLTGRECSPIIRNSDPPEYLSEYTKVTNQPWQIIFRR